MQRRIFVGGLLFFGGGLAGHYLTKAISGSAGVVMDPSLFAQATSGLKLQYLSQEMLLRIFSRQVTEADRYRLVAEIINHNHSLFVKQDYDRQYGVPGFFRIIE